MYNIDNVINRFNGGDELEYIFFWGHQKPKNDIITKSCFSLWYHSEFIVNGQKYFFAEQYMMAEKARIFHDQKIEEEILKSSDPKMIKEFGRRVKNFDELIWKNKSFEVVYIGNKSKFEQNSDMKFFLLETGNKIIVEASPYDKIWGIGMKEDELEINNPNKWKGTNLLGFALMRVRDDLRKCSV